MKKSIIALIFLLIPAFAFGQIFKEEATISDRAKSTARDLVGCNCPSVPITSDTKIKDVQREELDISLRLNAIDKPESGDYSFNLENFDIVANLNLNKVLFGYIWYGERRAVHDKAEQSATEPDWHFKYYGAGGGWYFTPVFKAFVGVGKVIDAENDGDAPSYAAFKEYGVGYDISVYSYKIELTYRYVDVPIDKDNVPVEYWPARGSYSTFSVGITAPFSLW